MAKKEQSKSTHESEKSKMMWRIVVGEDNMCKAFQVVLL